MRPPPGPRPGSKRGGSAAYSTAHASGPRSSLTRSVSRGRLNPGGIADQPASCAEAVSWWEETAAVSGVGFATAGLDLLLLDLLWFVFAEVTLTPDELLRPPNAKNLCQKGELMCDSSPL